VSRNNSFLFDNSKLSDALTQIVIRHSTAHEDVKHGIRGLIRPFWSVVEQADYLRKLFIAEIIQCLGNDQGKYSQLAKLIIMDWSRYVSYTIIGWAQIYEALETNRPLPSSCNEMTSALYRIFAKSGQWPTLSRQVRSRSYKEGGEMLCSMALTFLQRWFDYPNQRHGFSFGDANMQVIFHSYAYTVQWEKVVQALHDRDENEHLFI
jgi:hypothetical protein